MLPGKLTKISCRGSGDRFGTFSKCATTLIISEGFRKHDKIGLLVGNLSNQRFKQPALFIIRVPFPWLKMNSSQTNQPGRWLRGGAKCNIFPSNASFILPSKTEFDLC